MNLLLFIITTEIQLLHKWETLRVNIESKPDKDRLALLLQPRVLTPLAMAASQQSEKQISLSMQLLSKVSHSGVISVNATLTRDTNEWQLVVSLHDMNKAQDKTTTNR